LHCAIHYIAESRCARLTQGIQLDFTNCLLDPVIHPAFFPPEREQQTRFIRSSSPRHYPMSRSSPKSSSTCLTNFAIAQIPSLSFSTCLSVEVIVVRVRMTSQLPVLQEATCLFSSFHGRFLNFSTHAFRFLHDPSQNKLHPVSPPRLSPERWHQMKMWHRLVARLLLEWNELFSRKH
jgi:hypothetical protein